MIFNTRIKSSDDDKCITKQIEGNTLMDAIDNHMRTIVYDEYTVKIKHIAPYIVCITKIDYTNVLLTYTVEHLEAYSNQTRVIGINKNLTLTVRFYCIHDGYCMIRGSYEECQRRAKQKYPDGNYKFVSNHYTWAIDRMQPSGVVGLQGVFYGTIERVNQRITYLGNGYRKRKVISIPPDESWSYRDLPAIINK